MIFQMMKSVIDTDRTPIVFCGLDHRILYMNPAAVKEYQDRGGAALVGKSVFGCHSARSRAAIEKVVAWFGESRDHNVIHTMYLEKEQMDLYMVALRDESGALLGYYEKHEIRARETAKPYDFTA